MGTESGIADATWFASMGVHLRSKDGCWNSRETPEIELAASREDSSINHRRVERMNAV
jgi:hypothetical protein